MIYLLIYFSIGLLLIIQSAIRFGPLLDDNLEYFALAIGIIVIWPIWLCVEGFRVYKEWKFQKEREKQFEEQQ